MTLHPVTVKIFSAIKEVIAVPPPARHDEDWYTALNQLASAVDAVREADYELADVRRQSALPYLRSRGSAA